ncbi:MAG: hypothetical protein K2X80_20110 [Pseudomonadaceae bacterium]|nr:hypothetical protein [Pseudomonadaceae bacterium]
MTKFIYPTHIALFLDCCQRVLRAEQRLLDELTAAGFACTAADWQFTLPAVHQFLFTQLPAAAAPEYRQFIQQLYASDLNQRLRELGAEITLADNQSKVHRSLYCLRRLPPTQTTSALNPR